ncbi:MAG: iron(III) transport system substrate-binding protein [Thermoleophilaceae bacterium]|jgi:iron(III) transport system substrate-binding protein|nr:iron(III) transport system substrate-binding protein [Thermoleophilaceae bacterium]
MSRRSLLAVLIGGSALLVLALVGVVLATSGSSDDALDIYSARSHYGEEQPFEDFAAEAGIDINLRGGSATELYELIRAQGEASPADVLITVDAANLWRATEAGLLEPVRSAKLDELVPEGLRDPDGNWYGLLLRARTIMRSTERVGPDEVTTYEGLGDPRWKGRLCLRSGTSEYNVSFVADRLAKDGRPATERMLRRWMANEPEVLGSDTDVLDAIADGDCDVGLTNHYYLEREKQEDPDFPVAAVWADQDGRGTHVNLSGVGVVKGTGQREKAVELMEFLVQPKEQQLFSDNNHEFKVRDGVDFKTDPIDVAGAGAHLREALALMQEAGWD